MQPCDVGIIHILKAYYRRRFNQKLIDAAEAGGIELNKTLTLEEIQLVFETWTCEVSPPETENCFKQCAYVGKCIIFESVSRFTLGTYMHEKACWDG